MLGVLIKIHRSGTPKTKGGGRLFGPDIPQPTKLKLELELEPNQNTKQKPKRTMCNSFENKTYGD